MGTLQTASLSIAAAGLGRRQGVGPRAAGNGEKAKTSKRKSVRGRNEPIRNAPDVTPMPVTAVRQKIEPHQATKAK
jgi:hypothetical protein